jgi:hypothetical protein
VEISDNISTWKSSLEPWPNIMKRKSLKDGLKRMTWPVSDMLGLVIVTREDEFSRHPPGRIPVQGCISYDVTEILELSRSEDDRMISGRRSVLSRHIRQEFTEGRKQYLESYSAVGLVGWTVTMRPSRTRFHNV